MMQPWKLMQMNLNADFAVLSAGETVCRAVRSSEDIVGLSSALFVAAAPHVAESQWRIGSASTTELMLEFYRNLQTDSAAKKPTKAEAPRRARFCVMKNTRIRSDGQVSSSATVRKIRRFGWN